MKSEIITYEEPKSPISEIFRTLRTNIQYMNIKKGLRSILITSTSPSEGKSWISANLAVTFAQAGKKVVLVDADMRKGRQFSIFGISPTPGLSNYLSGINSDGRDSSTDIFTYIQKTEVENLYMLAAGNVPPNPSELLVTDQMEELIKILTNAFDLIIFDGTPSDLVTDAVIISRYVDTTLIVTSYKETKMDGLEKIKKNIENVGGKIAGVVINKMPISTKDYYYSYYYGSNGKKKKKKKKMSKKEQKREMEEFEIAMRKKQTKDKLRRMLKQNKEDYDPLAEQKVVEEDEDVEELDEDIALNQLENDINVNNDDVQEELEITYERFDDEEENPNQAQGEETTVVPEEETANVEEKEAEDVTPEEHIEEEQEETYEQTGTETFETPVEEVATEEIENSWEYMPEENNEEVHEENTETYEEPQTQEEQTETLEEQELQEQPAKQEYYEGQEEQFDTEYNENSNEQVPEDIGETHFEENEVFEDSNLEEDFKTVGSEKIEEQIENEIENEGLALLKELVEEGNEEEEQDNNEIDYSIENDTFETNFEPNNEPNTNQETNYEQEVQESAETVEEPKEVKEDASNFAKEQISRYIMSSGYNEYRPENNNDNLDSTENENTDWDNPENFDNYEEETEQIVEEQFADEEESKPLTYDMPAVDNGVSPFTQSFEYGEQVPDNNYEDAAPMLPQDPEDIDQAIEEQIQNYVENNIENHFDSIANSLEEQVENHFEEPAQEEQTVDTPIELPEDEPVVDLPYEEPVVAPNQEVVENPYNSMPHENRANVYAFYNYDAIKPTNVSFNHNYNDNDEIEQEPVGEDEQEKNQEWQDNQNP